MENAVLSERECLFPKEGIINQETRTIIMGINTVIKRIVEKVL